MFCNAITHYILWISNHTNTKVNHERIQHKEKKASHGEQNVSGRGSKRTAI